MLLFLFSLTFYNFLLKTLFCFLNFKKQLSEPQNDQIPVILLVFSIFKAKVLVYKIHPTGVLSARQCARSHCVYCSFSVVPADGERKRLYGVNERACRSKVGADCRTGGLCCDGWFVAPKLLIVRANFEDKHVQTQDKRQMYFIVILIFAPHVHLFWNKNQRMECKQPHRVFFCFFRVK